MNNDTKRRLFNTRRRYNNLRAELNAATTNEARNSIMNSIMGAAGAYMEAVKGASSHLPAAGPAPAPAPEPNAATLKEQLRAALEAHYRIEVTNSDLEGFTAGHLTIDNDPTGELEALLQQYKQALSTGGGGRNYNAVPINIPNIRNVATDQAFIESYERSLPERDQILRKLHAEISQKMAKSKRLTRNTPGYTGSQAYRELREEIEDDLGRYKIMSANMRKANAKYAYLLTNVSFANRRGGRGRSRRGRHRRAGTRKRRAN